MIAAPTAASLLKAVATNKHQADAARIADLADAEREAVVAALNGVSPKARIDVAALIAETRTRLAEAEARKPPPEAWRWALHVMAPAQLSTFKRLVKDGSDPDAAAREALATPADWPFDDVQPDEEFDDDDLDDAKPRRRQIPRRKPGERVSDTQAEDPTPNPAAPPSGRPRTPPPERAYLGPRAFDQYGALGPDPSFRPLRPPWLLSDPDDDEPDEGDDDDANTI